MNGFLKILVLLLLVTITVNPVNAQDPKQTTEKNALEAIERYSSDVKNNPNNVIAWNSLSTALLFLGKTSEGIATYKKAIKLNPKNASLRVNMGKALLDAGQLEEAISALHQALELNPESAAAWANLGGCLLKQGKLKEAYEATHKATGLGPADTTAWNNHAAALLYLEKPGESAAASQRAIKLDPKDALSWANLGAALLKQGKLEKSIAASEKATLLNPQESIAWNNLAGALLKQGKTEEGLNAIRKACEINPLNLNSWIKLGDAQLLRGEYEKAIKAARKAIDLDPKNIAALGILIKANGQLKHSDRVGILMARWLLAQSSADKTNNNKSLILEMAKGLKVLKVEVPLETPSPFAIQDYYKKHKNRYNNDQVHLKMISVPMSAKSIKEMEKLRQDLVNGEDFASLAKEHSDDSAAANGGDRGWMKRSDLHKGLADIIFSLKVKKISPVLEDLDHYRILTVIERKAGAPTPLEEVKERIIFQLKAAAMQQKIQQWIADARKELKEANSQ